MSSEAWLQEHGVQDKLASAVRHVIKERPADPVKVIGHLLLGLPVSGDSLREAPEADFSAAEEEEHRAFMEAELKRGDWASNRGAYDAVRMYYRWTFMPVSKDRRRPLSLIAARGITDYSERDIYTFGVYTGASLKFWFDGFDALNITTGPHWGFDSFEGLPAEAEGMELECKAWLPGSFSAADQFGVYTFAEVTKKIEEHVGEKYAPQTRLIKGFFSDSRKMEAPGSNQPPLPSILPPCVASWPRACAPSHAWFVRPSLADSHDHPESREEDETRPPHRCGRR